jgi:hypothetical protein
MRKTRRENAGFFHFYQALGGKLRLSHSVTKSELSLQAQQIS